jgi:hypothetical protein
VFQDRKMQKRSPSSAFLIYFGVITTALLVVVVGLTAVVHASTGWSQATAREKTLLELQVESSREIRRALATPTVMAPLPPITARPAHDPREIAAVSRNLVRTKPSQAAMDAMAMDQSGAYPPDRQNYPVPDRHAVY